MRQTPADGTPDQGGGRAGKGGRRIVRATFIAIGALLGLVGLALVALVATGATVRLPVPLESVLARVNNANSDFRVTAESAGISWNPRDGRLQVQLHDVVLQHVSGVQLGTARRLQAGGSARGFLRGNWDAVQLEIDRLTATFRTGDGPATLLAAGGGAFAAHSLLPDLSGAGTAAAIDMRLTDSRLRWVREGTDPTTWTAARLRLEPGADGFRLLGEATPEVAGHRGRIAFDATDTPDGIHATVEIENVAASVLAPTLGSGHVLDSKVALSLPADGGPVVARGSAQVPGELLAPLTGTALAPHASLAVQFELDAVRAPDGTVEQLSGRIDAGGQTVAMQDGGTIALDVLESAFAFDPRQQWTEFTDIRMVADRASFDGTFTLSAGDGLVTAGGAARIPGALLTPLIGNVLDPDLPLDVKFALNGFRAPDGTVERMSGRIDAGGQAIVLEDGGRIAVDVLESAFDLDPGRRQADFTDMRVVTDRAAFGGAISLRSMEDDATATFRLADLSFPALRELYSRPLESVEGRVDLDATDGSLALKDTTIRFGEHAVALSASLRGEELDAMLTLTGWKASELDRVWPEGYAADGRRWVLVHVQDGNVDGKIRLTGPLEDPGIALEFAFTDTVLGGVADFPQVTAGAGTGTLRDDRLVVEVARGTIEPEPGRNAIDLAGSRLEIADVADFARPARLTLRLDGTAAQTLALAAQAPIGFFPPEAVVVPIQGQVTTRVALAIPLDVPVTHDNVPFVVNGYFDRLGLTDENSGLRVEEGKGNFAIAAGRVRVAGEARVNAVPVTFEAATALAETPAAAPDAWDVSGTIEDLGGIVPAGVELTAGVLPFEANLRWNPESGWMFAAESGLDGVALAVGPHTLKRTHEDGAVRIDGRIGEAGLALGSVNLRLPSLALETGPDASRPGWYRFAGTLGGELLTHSDVPVESASDLPVSGAFSLQPGSPVAFSLVADFTAAQVDLDWANWVKPAGEPAALEVSGSWPALAQPIAFRFSAGSTLLEGEWQDAPVGGDWAVRVNPLRLGNGTLLALTAGPEGENPRWLEIVGPALDLRDFGSLTDVRPSGVEDDDEAVAADHRQLGARLQLRRLQLNDELWMGDAKGTLLVGPGARLDGRITGQTFDELDTSVVATIGPQESRILMEIDDAGEMLRAMGVVDSVHGGRVIIEPIFADERETGPSYRVQMRDFAVRDAPLLARLLSFISGVGLINYILEGSTSFESLEMQVTEDGDLLRMTGGVVESASLGFVFVGDLNTATDEIEIRGFATPLRFLTRILGEIPILGNLIQDSDGITSIAIGFRISGSREAPVVEVQPLTALIPFLPRLQKLETDAGTGAPPPAPGPEPAQ